MPKRFDHRRGLKKSSVVYNDNVPLSIIPNATMGIGDAAVYCWIFHSALAAGFDVKMAPYRNHVIFEMFGVGREHWNEEVDCRIGHVAPKGSLKEDKGWVEYWIQKFGYGNIPIVRPPYYETDDAAAAAERFWKDRDAATGGGKRVLVFPECLYKSRTYPESYFAEVAGQLMSEGHNVITLVTSYKEGHPFPWAMNIADLRVVTAMIARADLVIGNDSGPMHLAATLGVPGLSLHGPSTWMFYCHAPCIRTLSVSKEDMQCVNCNFDHMGGKGYRRVCDSGCMALGLLAPVKVVAEAKSILLGSEEKKVSLPVKVYRQISLGGGTNVSRDFREAMRLLIRTTSPSFILETGTFDGLGSTSAITSCLPEGCRFVSIEADPHHHKVAQHNLVGKPVELVNGLTMRKDEMPGSADEIRKAIRKKKERWPHAVIDGPTIPKAADSYFLEQSKDSPEDVLRPLMGGGPDIVLLDSAGHLGDVEFGIVEPLMKENSYLCLDDICHIKHCATYDTLRTSERWELVWESQEARHGSAIFRRVADATN